MDSPISLYWREKKIIKPDGSLRTFIRGYFKGVPAIMIKPSPDKKGLEEATAFYKIGKHLLKHQINIPEIYYFDENSGIIIVEDIGNIILENLVSSTKTWNSDLIELYKRVLIELLKFQFIGANNFNYNWCFDTPKYDSDFALQREGYYFLEHLTNKFFNLHVNKSVKHEVVELFSSLKEIKPYCALMHRDFQSRNLLLHSQSLKIYIIDFQGARYGPICYDLASILHDPYVMMPIEVVDKLKRFYIKNLKKYIDITKQDFEYQFKLLSIFRLMQALGAFARLSLELKKFWFKNYITSAINRLNYCLSFKEFQQYRQLRDIIDKLTARYCL